MVKCLYHRNLSHWSVLNRELCERHAQVEYHVGEQVRLQEPAERWKETLYRAVVNWALSFWNKELGLE